MRNDRLISGNDRGSAQSGEDHGRCLVHRLHFTERAHSPGHTAEGGSDKTGLLIQCSSQLPSSGCHTCEGHWANPAAGMPSDYLCSTGSMFCICLNRNSLYVDSLPPLAQDGFAYKGLHLLWTGVQIVLTCKLPGGQYFRSFMKQMHKNKDLTSLSWVSCVALSYSPFLILFPHL